MNRIVELFFRARGELKEAEAHSRRALEGQDRTLARDRIDALNKTVDNLGQLLQAQGKPSLAAPFMCRALEGFEWKLDRDRPHTNLSVDNLSKLRVSSASPSPSCRGA